ncbi:helix-turn-helix domain-containing protein [Streptomyces cinereoruber]|uniref:helix-turn-helix domain-containing protein n=1 Tax=Streptomyces cinereoruber TaxID=67260 RepID=UPI000D515A87|nr:hypothetical protein DBP18_04545 [Streptomyces sp. CS081A]
MPWLPAPAPRGGTLSARRRGRPPPPPPRRTEPGTVGAQPHPTTRTPPRERPLGGTERRRPLHRPRGAPLGRGRHPHPPPTRARPPGQRCPPPPRPAGQRRAELTAAGTSNRGIATTLAVSVKTVEATLTRAYRKLGPRSRVRLARTVGPAHE